MDNLVETFSTITRGSNDNWDGSGRDLNGETLDHPSLDEFKGILVRLSEKLSPKDTPQEPNAVDNHPDVTVPDDTTLPFQELKSMPPALSPTTPPPSSRNGLDTTQGEMHDIIRTHLSARNLANSQAKGDESMNAASIAEAEKENLRLGTSQTWPSGAVSHQKTDAKRYTVDQTPEDMKRLSSAGGNAVLSVQDSKSQPNLEVLPQIGSEVTQSGPYL